MKTKELEQRKPSCVRLLEVSLNKGNIVWARGAFEDKNGRGRIVVYNENGEAFVRLELPREQVIKDFSVQGKHLVSFDHSLWEREERLDLLADNG